MNVKNKLRQWAEKYPTLFEIIRFLIIGGFATIIDYAVSGLTVYLFNIDKITHISEILLNKVDVNIYEKVFSTGAGFIAGLIFNYIFSIKFVFIYKEKGETKLGFLYFSLLSIFGLIINLSGMYLATKYLKLNFWLIKIILTLIVLIYNYLSKKLILFNKK
ncbi:MAG: GtrA family protein [Clostridia bacterium]|nr:GtrA family protein [Clostridia bacterium]